MKYKQFFKQYESINKSCEDLLSAYSYIFHLGKTDYLYFYFYYNPQYSSKIGIYYNSKWHEQEYIEFSLGLLDFDYEQARDFFRQFKDEEEQKYRKQQAEEKEKQKTLKLQNKVLVAQNEEKIYKNFTRNMEKN